MAYLAASTSAGTRRPVNEDACCVKVAQTSLGEVLLAVVCDGVGGLSRGDTASSTVIARMNQWFEQELPALLTSPSGEAHFDAASLRASWAALLQQQNDLIRAHGTQAGSLLGTTFTALIACGGQWLAGHVGDCRAFQINAEHFVQLTEDQTLVARQLAEGKITAEEAVRRPKNVILQAVGTERQLKPVFYEGTFGPNDLFVICCDGAYHRAGNEGIQRIFQGCVATDEASLQQACDELLRYDMDHGEKDNLTVVCFSGALAAPGERAMEAPDAAEAAHEMRAAAPEPADEDDLPTMVELAPEPADEDDLPTMVDGGDA